MTGPPAAASPTGGAAASRPRPADEEGQPDPEEKGPLRRCVATRESLPKERMIRFVLGPGRELVPDLSERLPGRGMWLSARRDVLEAAVKRGAFARASRGQVHPPPDLSMRIEAGLRLRVRDLVGFARRAGQAVCGFQQAREWLQAERAGVVVQASDGSANERARLVGARGVPVVAALTAAELGGIFGRDHAVHVAVAKGRLAQEIAREAARLGGFTSAVESLRG
ncbi:RNA-binding protein [Roseomonas elaeocarpi]|uniref:RNA-binding protein n=1 Tax=Roseomonas elaeocarpi TaxID=907779 RepID=A0ABV6JNR7_9PROT